MRILLIEDDQLIGDGLNVGLGKLGFTVDWFCNGEEGFEAVFQISYDAVILDLGLPGKDGLVHISQISSNYIKHPSEVLAIGDTVEVKVLQVDVSKKRISLTMKL